MSAEPYPDLLEEVVRRRRAGESVVLATIVTTQGSVPRQAGARMMVLADGSIKGTIGGGPREAEIIAAARELHRWGGTRLLTVEFDGERIGSGPICGGRMEVFVERIDPLRRVFIAGAGHVGYFLHRFVALLGLDSVIVDDRPEFASEDRFPGATLVVGPFVGALAPLGITGNDAIVIVTAEHLHDLEVLREALATPAGYVGMIGSRKQVPALLAAIRGEGMSEEQVARVHAPIGLDIGAESPAEIGLAIAAEIVAGYKGRSLPGHGR